MKVKKDTGRPGFKSSERCLSTETFKNIGMVDANKKKKIVKKRKSDQKAYLKKLKKDDPEFYEAVLNSKEVIGDQILDDDDIKFSLDDNSPSLDSRENEEMSDPSELEENEDEEDQATESDEEGSEIENEDDGNEMENSDDGSDMEDEEGDKIENEDDGSEIEENGHDDTDLENEDEKSDGETRNANIITGHLLEHWHNQLQEAKCSQQALRNVWQALRAAIESIQGSDKLEKKSPFKVVGPQVFNDVVRLCLKDVAPALHSLFACKTLSDRPCKNKKWAKLSFAMKAYLRDLIVLTRSVTEPSVIEVILKKGILPIIPFYLEFSDVAWNLIKHLSSLWCTSETRVRVLSFIAIFRLMRSVKEEMRDKGLKTLYLSYVKNCRYTSPNTWPLIDFMRDTLVELYCIDQALAYRHTFIYVRQMAFHLRNAMTVQKEDRIQLVYNWQYIHCLHLWGDLLGKVHPSPILKPLIYPLIQIANGTIQLMKSPRYFPLVLHVCDILTNISRQTSTFVPILPFLLELLAYPKLVTRPPKHSAKPFEWPCIIKFSKTQLDESAFTDGMIEQIYGAFLKYLSSESSTIGFPELVFPTVIKVKAYLKKCRVATYSRKLRHLLDKVQENSNFIENRRRGVTFTICDTKAIKDWEISCLQSEPPLLQFYQQWKNSKGTDDISASILVPTTKLKKEEQSGDAEDRFSLKNIQKRERDDLEEDVQKVSKKKVEKVVENGIKETLDDVVTEMRLSDLEDDEFGDDEGDEEVENESKEDGESEDVDDGEEVSEGEVDNGNVESAGNESEEDEEDGEDEMEEEEGESEEKEEDDSESDEEC